MSDRIVARYKGPGYIAGIPARDLTAQDVAELGADERAALKAAQKAGTYTASGSKTAKKKSAPRRASAKAEDRKEPAPAQEE